MSYQNQSNLNLITPPETPKQQFISQEELLILSIDLGDGLKDKITVRQGDSPEQLAQKFCIKHHLDYDVKLALTEKIVENLKAVPTSERQVEKQHQKRTKSMFQRLSKPVSRHSVNQSIQENLNHSISLSQQVSSQLGQKLYYKGILKQQERQKRQEKQRLEQESELAQDLTFHPKINDRSYRLKNRNKSPEKLLHSFGQLKQEMLEQKRQEKQLFELSQCTFAPKVNSKPFASYQGENIFDKLYRDAKLYQEKQENKKNLLQILFRNSQQCPFKPTINNSSKSSRLSTLSQHSKRFGQDVINLNRMNFQFVDEVTGQEFFKPQIGRSPKQREANPKTIGDYLFNLSKKQTNSCQEKNQTYTYSTQSSKNILKKVKKTKYMEIFEKLKHSSSNLLKGGQIQRLNVNPDLLQLIQPLLNEIDLSSESLTHQEFYDSMEALMQSLTPDQRQKVLKIQVDRQIIQQDKLNNSISVKQSDDVWHRLVKYRSQSQKKNEVLRQRKRQEEMKHCTFKPKINEYVPSKLNFSLIDDIMSNLQAADDNLVSWIRLNDSSLYQNGFLFNGNNFNS